MSRLKIIATTVVGIIIFGHSISVYAELLTYPSTVKESIHHSVIVRVKMEEIRIADAQCQSGLAELYPIVNINRRAERTGWVSGDDGLLVRDINGDGIINNGGELFGDQTLLQNGQKAAGSFQALADLDSNADGKIDANDTAFSQMRIWQDLDGDGYSSADELKTLTELGITALNTGYTATNISDGLGNTQIQAGTFTKSDSSTGQMDGYLLQRDSAYTIPEEYLEVSAEIAALPDIQAYGNVYDLQQAMVRDTSGDLQTLVEQFMAETDADVLTSAGGTTSIISSSANIRNSTFEQILFKWTNSDSIDPASRGGLFDARKLAVLKNFSGKTLSAQRGQTRFLLPCRF